MHLWRLCLVFAINFKVAHAQKQKKKLPLVINTWAFTEANSAAWSYLIQRPKDPLNALVQGCSTCERLQCDGTVGYGGSPDERGETRLDAMIMDGKTMNIGAVASMGKVKDAIKVAKHVLENTRHTLLVGDAATDFAVSMGFVKESLTTPKSHDIWKKWLQNNCQPNYWQNVQPEPFQHCGPYEPITEGTKLNNPHRYEYKIGPLNHDTIGMIVITDSNEIYAGTSTNGATHKIPGRVGDSPIPGAGCYADNEVGAAVGTGDGDIMMRFLPSLLAVESMRSGKTPEEAAKASMSRIARYYKDFSGGLVVVDRLGNYAAACVGMENFPFSVASGDDDQRTRVEYVKCLDPNQVHGNYNV